MIGDSRTLTRESSIAGLALLDRNVKRQRAVAVFEPFERDALASFFWSLLIEVRHEDLEASLCGHASVAVDELSLVVDEVKVKPRVLRGIDHREIDVVHGELAEVERSPAQAKKIVPLCKASLVVARVAVDNFDVWWADTYGGKLTVDMRRGKQFLGVEDEVVLYDLNAGDITRVNKVGQFDMKAAKKAFQGDLQHVEFCNVKPHATIWSGREGANELNRERNNFVYGAVQLELVAFGLNRDVLERGVGRRTDVQVVTDVPYVRVDDAFLNLKDKRLWVIEGRIDLPAGANHLSTNPADVDTEVGTLAKKKVVRVDQGGGEIISGGSVGRAQGTDIRDWRRWSGGGCLGSGMPEEPAEAEDGNRGGGGDKGRVRTGHCAIPVLNIGLRPEYR
jgi:hypothetical protein